MLYKTKEDKERVIRYYYAKKYKPYEIYEAVKGAISRNFIENYYWEYKDIEEKQTKVLKREHKKELEQKDNIIKIYQKKALEVRKLAAEGIYNYLEKRYKNPKSSDSKWFLEAARTYKDLGFDTTNNLENNNSVNLTDIYKNLVYIFKEIIDTECGFVLIKGGRGSGKSIGLADVAILCSFDKKYFNTNFLCFRQFQVSMQASMHALLKERIYYYKLDKYFNITITNIVNMYSNITIYFKGMVDPNSVRSATNVSLAIGDEGQQMNTWALEQVLPSIRRTNGENSKIIMAMNPVKPIDPVLAFVNRQKENALIKHFNIFDLPEKYQNKSLLMQAEADKKSNYELYKHKWLGEPSPIYAGTPFSNILTTDFDEYITPEECQMYIDPAFSGVNDYTAVTIMWPGAIGTCYQRYMMVYGKVYKLNYRDAAPYIAELVIKFKVDTIIYEKNGGAHSFCVDLEKQLEYLKYDRYIIKGVNNNISKSVRINKLIGLIDLFMFIKNNETKEYIEQVLNYNPDFTNKINKQGYYDDAPDSLAGFCEYFLKV